MRAATDSDAAPAMPEDEGFEGGPSRRALRGVGVAVFLFAAALYVRTLAPSVMPGDYAEFQMCAAILGVPHPTGYPLYILLGKLFTLLPVGDVAYRVNLSSAIYMAGAAAVIVAVGVRLLSSLKALAWWWAPVIGAVFFALAPTPWSMALVARSYALNALLVGSVILALVSWRGTERPGWFYAACVLVGLSLVHHGTTYFLLPAYGVYLALVEIERRRSGAEPRPWPRRWRGALAFLVGYSPILFLVYRFVWGSPYYWGNPSTWKDFFNLLGGGPFQGQVLPFGGLDTQLARVASGLGELAGQYTVAGILLGLLGLALLWWRMRGEAALLTLMMLGNFGFAMNYGLVGYLYFIPTFLMFAILIGVAIGWLGASVTRLLGRGVAPAVASAGTAFAFGALALVALVARFPALDLSAQTDVRDETLALLEQAPKGASLYLDWEDVAVVRFYRLVYNLRPDLTLYTGDPADWPKWVYCDLENNVAVYVGEFAGAQLPIIARDFTSARVPLAWRITGVRDGSRYEIPPCGTCATCR